MPPIMGEVWLRPRRPRRAGAAPSVRLPSAARRGGWRGDDPVRRRPRGQPRPAHAARLPAAAARALRADVRGRQRRERGGRTGHHPEGRRAAASRRASTRSRSATTPTTGARSTRTSTPSRGSCAPPTTCAASRGAGCAWCRAPAGMRLGVVNLSGSLYLRPGARRLSRSTGRCSELGEVDHMLVDMHAEATSEKIALGWLPRRARERGGRHPHPRPHRRRPRAARAAPRTSPTSA